MVLSEWSEFPSAPCLAGKKKHLMRTRFSMLLTSRASLDTLNFSLCNKKRLVIRRMNRPLFPTTLSIPSYNIGKYVGLRTYQHPLVICVLSLQVHLLLRQLPVSQNWGAGESILAERFHIQNQELEKMEGLRNELKDKSEELDKLKSLLAAKQQGLNKVELYMAVIHI